MFEDDGGFGRFSEATRVKIDYDIISFGWSEGPCIKRAVASSIRQVVAQKESKGMNIYTLENVLHNDDSVDDNWRYCYPHCHHKDLIFTAISLTKFVLYLNRIPIY